MQYKPIRPVLDEIVNVVLSCPPYIPAKAQLEFVARGLPTMNGTMSQYLDAANKAGVAPYCNRSLQYDPRHRLFVPKDGFELPQKHQGNGSSKEHSQVNPGLQSAIVRRIRDATITCDVPEIRGSYRRFRDHVLERVLDRYRLSGCELMFTSAQIKISSEGIYITVDDESSQQYRNKFMRWIEGRLVPETCAAHKSHLGGTATLK